MCSTPLPAILKPSEVLALDDSHQVSNTNDVGINRFWGAVRRGDARPLGK